MVVALRNGRVGGIAPEGLIQIARIAKPSTEDLYLGY